MRRLILLYILMLVANGYADPNIDAKVRTLSQPTAWKTPSVRTAPTVCNFPDDETIPDFELELSGKTAAEYEKIITQNMSSNYSYDSASLRCSEKHRAASPELAEEGLKAFLQLVGYGSSQSLSHNSSPEDATRCGLTDFEMRLITYYTASGYSRLNNILRKKITNPSGCQNVAPAIETLNGALTKLAPHKGFVRRGFIVPESIGQLYKTGQIVREFSFLSTSYGNGFPGTYRALILTKNCVNITPLAQLKSEREVLCPAGSEFYVHHRTTTSHYGDTWILMEQIK